MSPIDYLTVLGISLVPATLVVSVEPKTQGRYRFLCSCLIAGCLIAVVPLPFVDWWGQFEEIGMRQFKHLFSAGLAALFVYGASFGNDWLREKFEDIESGRQPSAGSLKSGSTNVTGANNIVTVGPVGSITINNHGDPQRSELPDVSLRFLYGDRPTLQLLNPSKTVAKNIKWTVLLWNIDDPRVYSGNSEAPKDAHEPLRIPVGAFDFIRPGQMGGPMALFDSPAVSPFVKPGDRLIGSASVSCPDCSRGRTYIVSITFGKDGWFSEIEREDAGNLVVPKPMTVEGVRKFYDLMQAHIPIAERKRILDQ